MREPATPLAGAAALTDVPPRTWSQTFPATPDQVRHARRFLASVLASSPAAPDALICLSELAANSVQHSRSRRPGGQFTVRATLHKSRLRAEVEDDGGPWEPPSHLDSQRGRGLLIVGCLAHQWGITADTTTRIVWFEIGQLAGQPHAHSQPSGDHPPRQRM